MLFLPEDWNYTPAEIAGCKRQKSECSYSVSNAIRTLAMSLCDEIDAGSPPEPVRWEEEGMTEWYEKSPAIWLGFLNGLQSIPIWCG